ncbi:hypothetical protein [Vibrio sagamiensis]|uniref:Lipoprotein n=1 Tax=Vibrio sagamiensis NBRC 104589 TaxID=1219064 RepID=A0A511QIZ6_9VIBR|nr:hypothetical protein [Vibrio sagamiensis]PNQ53633.1 hypothetical protein C1141_20240 [Vibrio agarivorans]GEM77304.1 hypothetical protein VSA01S_34160 [Vibrio sagamiensis NBRC 104589]
MKFSPSIPLLFSLLLAGCNGSGSDSSEENSSVEDRLAGSWATDCLVFRDQSVFRGQSFTMTLSADKNHFEQTIERYFDQNCTQQSFMSRQSYTGSYRFREKKTTIEGIEFDLYNIEYDSCISDGPFGSADECLDVHDKYQEAYYNDGAQLILVEPTEVDGSTERTWQLNYNFTMFAQ